MPYTLCLTQKDNTVIESPFIVPDNPAHDMNDPKITNSIINTGAHIMKRDEDTIKYECKAY